MFKFFKEKLKSWFGKSKEEVEKKIEEKVEEVKKAEEIEEAEEKLKEEAKKIEEKVEKVKKEEVKEIEKEEIKEEEIVKIEEEKKEEIKEEEKVEKEKAEGIEIAERKEKAEEVEIKEVEEKEEEKAITREAPTIEELEKEKEEGKKEKPSIFKRLKEKFSYKLSEEDFEDIFENLELLLLENNVALEATEAIKKQLKEQLLEKEIKKENLEQEIKQALKKAIENILIEPDDILSLVKIKQPFVIVFFGINGTGKTTTIAKVASLLLKNKISCVLAASDTFRAASIEQLQEHASKLNVKLIKHDYGADPTAVAFDAIKHAKAHGIQVVLIDTAGRMHTKENLLSEMEKICRVTNPDLKIFVAESIAGNDAIQQAKNFNEVIGIDASILTKADVDEKGGTAISISYITKKPILYLGTGQKLEDLELFDKEKFIKELGL